MYRFILMYITPVIKIMLSYNRLHYIPKNEISDIHWKIILLFACELLMLPTAILFTWARIYYPAPQMLIYSILMMVYIISFLSLWVVKKNKYYELLIEEADGLTEKEHRTRRKNLLPIFLLYYMSPLIIMWGVCWLVQYLTK